MTEDRDALLELVRGIVVSAVDRPLPALSPKTTLAEAGVDSVTVAEIVVGIEEKLGIEIPADQWVRIRTFDDLISAIALARQNPAA
jgi:acyl carrier protein